MKELFTETAAFKTNVKTWGDGAFGLIPSPEGVDPASYWWRQGIVFNDRDCAGAGSHNACNTAPKCDPVDTSVVRQSPFTVYSNLSCGTEEGVGDAVLNALLYKTPWVLSRELETAPSRVTTGLTDPAVVDVALPVSSNTYDIFTAVQNLIFNRDKNGVPFSLILAPAWMEVLWEDRPRSGSNYTIVFLPGWQGLEPVTGASPAVGFGWITAVSNVEYVVSDPMVSTVFNQVTNTYDFWAKRQAILRFSVCNVLSILVGA